MSNISTTAMFEDIVEQEVTEPGPVRQEIQDLLATYPASQPPIVVPEDDETEDEDDGGTTTTDDRDSIATSQRRENAFAIINTFLQRAGLTGLEGRIRELLSQGIEDSDAILYSLRDSDQFKARFKANAARAKAGLPELDPATYIGLEEAYRQLMRANGLPVGFYDEPDDFQKLLEGDVSVQEVNERIQQGYRMVAEADPEVKRQMERLYGVDEAGLVSYFLDPQRAAPILTRQAQAAKVSARAREQTGFQLGVQTAEDLIARGYSPDEAQRVFQQMGGLRGLYEEMGTEETLSEQEKIGAAFGFDVEAQERLDRRRGQRLAEFQGGGQFARTTGATSGTVETGAGFAQ